MNCRLAREALSARIDGEREPVSVRSVDKHLVGCSDCGLWYTRAVANTQRLQVLARESGLRRRSAAAAVERAAENRPRRLARPVVLWARWSLALVGVLYLVLTVTQMTTARVAHSDVTGIHLFGESTAWSIAIGAAMIIAGTLPAAAAGLAGVLITYTCVLAVYVVTDTAKGIVSAPSELGHLPVLVGAILALLVWRGTRTPHPTPIGAGALQPDGTDIMGPYLAPIGSGQPRRSPRDGSAA
ncbi:putative integral membrane protein [Mycolicibacterium rhodesiae NBB3]|uniref:Putative integral membrane protein n=1 Tax=Mycolicibacterium rhodesiae (strain NBB3) TaxID=710685 RepID=G8RLG5_MYCRN|nr:zf-HC2 domain-containing protein [Mycolicibacterium rhodesiae]AEV73597.1 putative integral membrane protein [Mycolicibacterium rhodesiae NBB3]